MVYDAGDFKRCLGLASDADIPRVLGKCNPYAYLKKTNRKPSNFILPLSTIMQRTFKCVAASSTKDSDKTLLALQQMLADIFLSSLGLPTKKGDLSYCTDTSMRTPIQHGAPVKDNNMKHETSMRLRAPNDEKEGMVQGGKYI